MKSFPRALYRTYTERLTLLRFLMTLSGESEAKRVLPPRVPPVPRSSSVPCAKLQAVRGQLPREYNMHNLVLNRPSLGALAILLFNTNEQNVQIFSEVFRRSLPATISLPHSFKVEKRKLTTGTHALRSSEGKLSWKI